LYNTFDDEISLDHAEHSVRVLREQKLLESLDTDSQELVFCAIYHHNKFELPARLSDREYLYVNILRDADKLDILKVLTDYYSNITIDPNHALTWNMPNGNDVSADVANDILAGKLISRNKVKNDVDLKILQLSWVYDLNYKPSLEKIRKKKYFEKIYKTLPKNDLINEIYNKTEVYIENKLSE
jgi:hypothetical protein